MKQLNLNGISAAPAQVWGSVRLIPLLRDEPVDDLRMGLQPFGENNLTQVVTKGLPDDWKESYFAFIPHGLIAHWGEDAKEGVAWRTHLKSMKQKKQERRPNSGPLPFASCRECAKR